MNSNSYNPCGGNGSTGDLPFYEENIIIIHIEPPWAVWGNNMRNKVIKILGVAVTAVSIFMAAGWSFFNMIVRCKEQKKLMKRKWFQLSHTTINHPRHKFEKEYEEGKAWCMRQDMQDCYMKSKDGLLLHAYYLPAENAERFVLLSHGYKGSGFGDFAYTSRFLHENRCNLLFIDQRCCGASKGEYITFGAMEQYDVQRWAYYIARRNKKKLPIYLHGGSVSAYGIRAQAAAGGQGAYCRLRFPLYEGAGQRYGSKLVPSALDRASASEAGFILHSIGRFPHEGCGYSRGYG